MKKTLSKKTIWIGSLAPDSLPEWTNLDQYQDNLPIRTDAATIKLKRYNGVFRNLIGTLSSFLIHTAVEMTGILW